MIVKMNQNSDKEWRERLRRCKKCLLKYLEEIKSKQTEMNNVLEGIHSRITEAEERINHLEGRTVEITATEQNIEKRMKKK